MKLIVLSSLLLGGAGVYGASDPPTSVQLSPQVVIPSLPHLVGSVNINSRYIVEAVDLNGYNSIKLSDSLKDRIEAMIGQPYDTEAIEEIAGSLRKEIHAKAVSPHIAKGSNQESIRLVYDVTRRTAGLDISVPKFLYHSKQGLSGQVEANATISRNQTVAFGIVSDGDEMVERYTGFNARYDNTHLGTDRVRFQFLFESYHEQWNSATTNAVETPGGMTRQEVLESPDIYRSRRNFQPLFTFVIAKPLLLTVGASFMEMKEDIPSIRPEAANALIFGLRYHKQLGTAEDVLQTIDSTYEFKSALRDLGSNYVYTKHRWQGGYNWTKGHHTVTDVFTAGYISGRAPVYERFVVGTSSLLRGWNRYEIDPVGGNRLLHNSVEYRYKMAGVFYDCGSLWNLGRVPSILHSVGIGIHQSIFTVAVAVPIRNDGRFEPTLLVGMNY
jgi:outer membrane protein assembly factor BamA